MHLNFAQRGFITHTTGAEHFDIRKHRVKLDDNEYQIHPALFYQLYVRFMSIRRSFAQYTMWDTVPVIKDMPPTRWGRFCSHRNATSKNP